MDREGGGEATKKASDAMTDCMAGGTDSIDGSDGKMGWAAG